MISNIQELETTIMGCEKCPRLRSVTPTPMPHSIYAKDKIRLLIVGRNPGLEHDYTEVTKKTPMEFMEFYSWGYRESRVGKYIEKHLGKNVWDYCAITNLCKCSSPGNSTLKEEEINNCVDYLKNQILLFKPEIILTLGKDALLYGIGEKFEYLIKDDAFFNTYNDNLKLYAIYHPTYTIYSKYGKALNEIKLEKLKRVLEQ